ncbi:MAG: restriction endonuclease [Myxococcales bacterium]|nr:restriction endonuclease [Myxococcales bacterium]
MPDRKWEEIIAAAYDAEGYAVELTKRSGDGGRRCDRVLGRGPRVQDLRPG